MDKLKDKLSEKLDGVKETLGEDTFNEIKKLVDKIPEDKEADVNAKEEEKKADADNGKKEEEKKEEVADNKETNNTEMKKMEKPEDEKEEKKADAPKEEISDKDTLEVVSKKLDELLKAIKYNSGVVGLSVDKGKYNKQDNYTQQIK